MPMCRFLPVPLVFVLIPVKFAIARKNGLSSRVRVQNIWLFLKIVRPCCLMKGLIFI